MNLIEDLRCRLAEIDAFANAAEEVFRQIPWTIHRRHRRDLGRFTHLMSNAAEAAHAAISETMPCDRGGHAGPAEDLAMQVTLDSLGLDEGRAA